MVLDAEWSRSVAVYRFRGVWTINFEVMRNKEARESFWLHVQHSTRANLLWVLQKMCLPLFSSRLSARGCALVVDAMGSMGSMGWRNIKHQASIENDRAPPLSFKFEALNSSSARLHLACGISVIFSCIAESISIGLASRTLFLGKCFRKRSISIRKNQLVLNTTNHSLR